jgi:hypothetical protein
MAEELDESLLRDLAQPLVAELSPAEDEELFPLLSEAHFADPDAYADEDQRSGPLAFGLPELTVLLTPVVLAALTEVVRYIAGVAVAKGWRATSRAIRRLFGRKPIDPLPPEETLDLTPEQWAEIHRIVERVALRGGVGADQAGAIADAVVGQGQLRGHTA